MSNIVGKEYDAMSLLCFIFIADDKSRDNEVLIRHEKIHFYQQLELLFVFQWILYGIFHLIYGYDKNPFEREAYENEKDKNYLGERFPLSWVKYI
jgi:hypothetical protein